MLTIYKNQKVYHDDIQGIYSITFDNNKRYIGLSSRVKERLWEHYKSMEDLNDQLPVHEAMRKHEFVFELIEECSGMSRKELCEREKYWIKYYQTYLDKTKGYNLTPGGDGASPGCANSSAKLNETQINEIYQLLICDLDMYIYEIANKYNISPEAISDINNGRRYYNEFLQYPLRKKPIIKCEKGTNHHLALFNEYEIEQIYTDLKKSDITLEQIANKYNCSYTTISKINRGLEYDKKDCTYPIRKDKKLKLTHQQIDEIYTILLNSNQTYKSIGEKYQVSADTIRRLNRGETYQKEGYIYPLRALK